LAAVVEVITSDAQSVDESGEGEQRELMQQDERNRQLRLGQRDQLGVHRTGHRAQVDALGNIASLEIADRAAQRPRRVR
jgi:hypothetical protein